MGTEKTEPFDRATDERRTRSGVTRLEWGAAALAAVVLGGLTIAEPDIVGAPFENARTLVLTCGGTAAAVVALVAMVRMRVHPVARILLLGAPFVAVSWWLISPFFVDDVANDDFVTSIADSKSSAEQVAGDAGDVEPAPAQAPAVSTPPASGEPALLGAGQFVGLAGHDGSGDAGFFAVEGGSRVLRLENFDIQNGPDLRLYVVAGADQTEPGDESLYLGALRGNVGNQTYDLPDDFELAPGEWTILVWCEAFGVEFVAATVTVV